jgi:sigma-B regulation protein RsbQ
VPLALPATEVLIRNHVRVSGRPDGRPLVFVHGFACDQRRWEQIAAAFESECRVVTLDLVGAGQSDVTAYFRDGR